MEPSNIGIKIRDATSVTSLIQHATLGYFKIDMTKNISDRGHDHFLKLTCDVGNPPSRAFLLDD